MVIRLVLLWFFFFLKTSYWINRIFRLLNPRRKTVGVEFQVCWLSNISYLSYSSSVCSISASAARAQCFLSVWVSISASMSMIHAVMAIFVCTIAFGFYGAPFGQGTGPVFLRNVGCTGTESSLLSCSHRSGSCSHFQDAGVVCPSCKL